MKINPLFSLWVRRMSFVAAICVVVIHANSVSVVQDPARWNVIAHNLVCRKLTCWAVPFFFAVSGFFFAVGPYCRCERSYAELLKAKVRSLRVPYVFWTLVATAALVPLVVVNNLQSRLSLFANTFLSTDSFWGSLNSMLGLCAESPKHLAPMWFLRALFLLFIAAPFWRLFCKKSIAWMLLAAWGVAMAIGVLHVGAFTVNLDRSSFFLIGLLAGTYVPRKWLFSESSIRFGHKPWFLAFSFWLYCVHYPIITWVLASGHYVFGKGNVAVAMLTLFSTIITIGVSLWLGRLCRAWCPRLFAVGTGWRSD